MPYNKLKPPLQLKKILLKHKRKGKKIVFTNGCFDILHLGHVRYLEKAKSFGDLLVVGLNSDSSTRTVKGLHRPIINESSRAAVIAGLAAVNYIAIFKEKTPLDLIKLLRPDILVKGGDWKKNDIVGASFVNSYGGKVKTVPYVKGYSTTHIINKIKAV